MVCAAATRIATHTATLTLLLKVSHQYLVQASQWNTLKQGVPGNNHGNLKGLQSCVLLCFVDTPAQGPTASNSGVVTREQLWPPPWGSLLVPEFLPVPTWI